MTVKGSRVENRRSNCSLPWLVDWAFASSPQSGLAWSCFLFPLIEPDWQISRIRLSEKTHAFAHGRFAVRCGNWTKPYTEFRDASGKRLYANQFPGGSCTRCSPAPFTAHCYASWPPVPRIACRTQKVPPEWLA